MQEKRKRNGKMGRNKKGKAAPERQDGFWKMQLPEMPAGRALRQTDFALDLIELCPEIGNHLTGRRLVLVFLRAAQLD